MLKNRTSLVSAILNVIIPGDNEKNMPGAGSFDEFNDKHLHVCPELFHFINEYFNEEEVNRPSINKEKITEALKKYKSAKNKYYMSLIIYVIEFYYSRQEVLKLIGKQSNPPFPSGNDISESDLSVFEQVFIRGDIYRK